MYLPAFGFSGLYTPYGPSGILAVIDHFQIEWLSFGFDCTSKLFSSWHTHKSPLYVRYSSYCAWVSPDAS